MGATAREAPEARQGHGSCPRTRKAQRGEQRAGSLSLVGRKGRTSAALALLPLRQSSCAWPRSSLGAAAAQQKPARVVGGGRDGLGERGASPTPHLPQSRGSAVGSPHPQPAVPVQAAFPTGSGRATAPTSQSHVACASGRHRLPEAAPNRQALALGGARPWVHLPRLQGDVRKGDRSSEPRRRLFSCDPGQGRAGEGCLR